MVPIRVLLLFAIPLIGIILQKSSSKSIDKSDHHVESSSLEGENELIRTKRDVDSTITDMAEYERAMGDSALTNEDVDETEEIEKRGRRRRRGGRRRSRRRRSGRRRSGRRRSGRRGSGRKGSRKGGSGGGGGMGALDAFNSGLGVLDSGLGLAQTVNDMNQGNDNNEEDY
ncbi:protein nemuri-like isoform X2 [Ostrea edulis]|uniref:protein nemuri-like isoform X2 n=1 Tax=Ostrea edulis TaxID=37623 RepID=UPI0024AF4744|nr:protein nemuri-like isoform X2 [Ostrea edulis]